MRYMKILGWTVLVSLGVVVALMALSIVLINSIRWDRRSQFVIRQIESRTDYVVDRLDGLDIHIGRVVTFHVDSMALHAKDPSPLSSMKVGRTEGSVLLSSIIFGRGPVIRNFEMADASFRMDELQAEKMMRPDLWLRVLDIAPSLGLESARLRNLRLAYDDAVEKETVTFALDDLVIDSRSQSGKTNLTAEASVGSMAMQLNGSWGAGPESEGQKAIRPLEMRLTGGNDLHAELKGQMDEEREASHYTVEVQKLDPNPFIEAFRLKLGTLPPMTLSMHLVQTEDRLQTRDFAMQLGGTRFEGTLSSDIAGPRPAVEVDLRSPSIRLRDVSGLLIPRHGQKSESSTLFSRDILPLTLLQSTDARLRLKVPPQKAASPELAFHDVNVEASLKDQKLTIDPMSFAMGQGRIQGTMQASLADRMETSLRLTVRNLLLEDALQAFPKDLPVLKLKPAELMRGRLLGSVEIQSQGRSVHELAAHADGRSQFAVEDGKLSKAASEAFGFNLVGILAAMFKDRPLTDLQCMISSFVGKNGVFRSEAFVMSTPDVNIQGRGIVNLGQESIDMTLEASPRKTVIGAILLPVRVSGPLTDISIDLGDKDEKQSKPKPDQDASLGQTLAGLLLFVEPAFEKESSCRRYLATLSRIRTGSRAVPSSEATGRAAR